MLERPGGQGWLVIIKEAYNAQRKPFVFPFNFHSLYSTYNNEIVQLYTLLEK